MEQKEENIGMTKLPVNARWTRPLLSRIQAWNICFVSNTSRSVSNSDCPCTNLLICFVVSASRGSLFHRPEFFNARNSREIGTRPSPSAITYKQQTKKYRIANFIPVTKRLSVMASLCTACFHSQTLLLLWLLSSYWHGPLREVEESTGNGLSIFRPLQSLTCNSLRKTILIYRSRSKHLSCRVSGSYITGLIYADYMQLHPTIFVISATILQHNVISIHRGNSLKLAMHWTTSKMPHFTPIISPTPEKLGWNHRNIWMHLGMQRSKTLDHSTICSKYSRHMLSCIHNASTLQTSHVVRRNIALAAPSSPSASMH